MRKILLSFFLPAMLSIAFDFYPEKISKYFLKNKNRTYIYLEHYSKYVYMKLKIQVKFTAVLLKMNVNGGMKKILFHFFPSKYLNQ